MARVQRSDGTFDSPKVVGELRNEGLDVTEWADEPGAAYPTHSHAEREVRVVLTGEMTITAGGRSHRLGPGDRIDLDPGEPHSAQVSADGVTYLAGTNR